MYNTNDKLVEGYLNYVQQDFNLKDFVITEAQMETFLSEAEVVGKKVNSYLEKVETKYKKLYSISFESIKKLGKTQGKRLKTEFKKGTTPEELGKKIAKSSKDFIIAQAKKAVNSAKGLTITEKVAGGILAFMIIIFINTMLMTLLTGLLSPPVVTQVVAVVIAPMVEEAAKTYFIKIGMPWIGSSIVFGLEAIMYIMNLVMAGAKVSKVIILRLTALLVHFSTTYVQKKIIDKNGDESTSLYVAWACGVAIHASWNTLSLLLNDKIAQLIFK